MSLETFPAGDSTALLVSFRPHHEEIDLETSLGEKVEVTQRDKVGAAWVEEIGMQGALSW